MFPSPFGMVQVNIKQKRNLDTICGHYPWKVISVRYGMDNHNVMWVLDDIFSHLLYIHLIFLTSSSNDQQRLQVFYHIAGYSPHSGSCIEATKFHKPFYRIPIHSFTVVVEEDVGIFNFQANSKLSILSSVLVKLTDNSFYDSLTLHFRPSFSKLLPHVCILS